MTNLAPVNTVVNEEGTLLQDRTVGGVTLTAGMTPTERFNALVKASDAGTLAPAHNGNGPPLGYQTEETRRTLTQRDAAASKAPPTPEQLEKQNAMRLEAAGIKRDTAGRFAAQHVIGDAAIAMLTGHFARLPVEQQRAQQTAFEAVYARIRNDGAAVRRTANGSLEAYDPGKLDDKPPVARAAPQPTAAETVKAERDAKPGQGKTQWSYLDDHGIRTLSIEAQDLQSKLQAEFKALPEKEQRSPRIFADYATALAKLHADERGELDASQFAPGTLSGYKLPPGKYAPETIQHLALACAAMLSQAQVETAIRNLRDWNHG